MHGNELNSWLEKALKKIDEMPREEFYFSFFGFTEEEYNNYTKMDFLSEVLSFKEVLLTCGGVYSPDQYCEETLKINPSKLFNHYLSQNYESTEDLDCDFSNSVYIIPEHDFKIQYIHGQGTLEIYSLI